jgi:hypothetical protein
MTEYKSRAVRSMVELHDAELRACLATWKRFVASGKPLPDARGDADYESPERLIGHVQASARSYMLWIGEVLERPFAGPELMRDAAVIVPRVDAFMEETLAGWAQNLASLTDDELGPKQYQSRWGHPFMIDQMLEHAVIHPMRHRIQLERILAG